MKHIYHTKPGIYKMFNVVTGNFYIGSSKNISMRIGSHRMNLKKGYKDNIRVARDLVDHGIDSFKFELIEYCDFSITHEREQYYYELLKPYYNIWPTVYSASGRSYTDEQLKSFQGRSHIIKDKKSFSEKLKKVWAERKASPGYEEYIKRLSSIPRVPITEETRKKLSLARKGKPKSKSMKEKTRLRRLDTKWDSVNRVWTKLGID